MILVATGAFFQALRFMPIADAIAIFFVSPLILTLLGALLLGEEVGPRRIIACLVGFGGTLLVIRPSFEVFGAVAFLPLATALLFALYMLLTRRMAQRMHPVTMQAYTALATTALVVPVLIAFDGSGKALFDPAWPDGWGWVTLIGVGIAATVTHLFLSFALRLAPAATLAPLHYLEIAAATTFGWLVFSDLPDGLTVLGIAIIVGSGIFVLMRERKVSQRVAKPVSHP
jgi:drug/metabolite transporter (DMT)-like permease